MPLPVAGLVAAAAVPELFKMIQGGRYNRMGKEYAKAQRPTYEIPQAVKDYLAQTKFRAGTFGLPGEGRIYDRLNQQTASQARAMRQTGQSAASQIAGLAALDQSTKESVADLGVEAARQNQREMQDMYRAQSAMADEQRREWEWNKRGPYENAMKTASDLQYAGREGVYLGLEGFSGIAQSALMMGNLGKGVGDLANIAPGALEKFAMNAKPIMAPERSAEEDLAFSGLNRTNDGTFFDESGNPYTDNIGFELPNEFTNAFNSQYYGIPINDQTSDYYNLGGGFNRMFNSLFRRRGSERTRTYNR